MRVGQIPVGVAHVPQRGRDGLPQLDVGDLPVLERLLHLLPDVVDAEAAHKRLASRSSTAHERNWGEKVVKALLVVSREPSQPTLYCVPHFSVC